MALLEAGGIPLLEDASRPPDADNPLGYHEYAPVRSLPRDAAWVAGAAGRAVKVIHALLPWLPEGPSYRVILVRRDLRAVVASQDRMLARQGGSTGRLGAHRLAAVLSAQMNEARAWLRARPHVAWMELDYDGLLREPEPELARLVAFAGLRASPRELAGVIAPAGARRRSPREAGPATTAAGPFDER